MKTWQEVLRELIKNNCGCCHLEEAKALLATGGVVEKFPVTADSPLSALKLSTRTHRAITRQLGDLVSVGEVLRVTRMQLMKFRGFGEKSYREYIDAVHAAGLEPVNKEPPLPDSVDAFMRLWVREAGVVCTTQRFKDSIEELADTFGYARLVEAVQIVAKKDTLSGYSQKEAYFNGILKQWLRRGYHKHG